MGAETGSEVVAWQNVLGFQHLMQHPESDGAAPGVGMGGPCSFPQDQQSQGQEHPKPTLDEKVLLWTMGALVAIDHSDLCAVRLCV